MWPRYFVPRDGAAPETLAGARVARAIDAFELRSGPQGAEWVVGFDGAGRFTAERRGGNVELLPATRRELAFQEVAARGQRVISLPALHVFEATLLEQTPDCAGLDDPVFLHGRLVGPLSAASQTAQPSRIEGQIATTRGDLLSGLVSGARWPFHRRGADTSRVEPMFSALLPADRNEAVSMGRGGVIVYPVIASDPATEQLFPGNGELVKQLLYDLLTALWRDVERERGVGYRSAEEIPSVSHRGLNVSNYLELAAEALQMSPLWPSAAVLEMNRMVGAPDVPSRSPGWVETFSETHRVGAKSVLPPPLAADADPVQSPARDPWAGKSAAQVLAMLDRRDR